MRSPTDAAPGASRWSSLTPGSARPTDAGTVSQSRRGALGALGACVTGAVTVAVGPVAAMTSLRPFGVGSGDGFSSLQDARARPERTTAQRAREAKLIDGNPPTR